MKILGFNVGTPRPAVPVVAQTRESAPGTEIRYDPHLVPRFVEAHHQLTNLIGELAALTRNGQYDQAMKALHQFKVSLYDHLLEENVRLYTYLTYCLREDADGRELMDDMRREMGQIGRTATRFIKAYTDTGISAGNAQAFLQQLNSVASVLQDRVRREEQSLYTLYQPPSHFGSGGAID